MAGEITVGQAKGMLPFLDHAYGDGPVPEGWTVIGTAIDANTGLRAFAYQKNSVPRNGLRTGFMLSML